MQILIAKTYPFILLCAILSKELDGDVMAFLPDTFHHQFRLLRRKEIREVQKQIRYWPNRFPQFLETFHKNIGGDKMVYDPLFYRYVAYRLLYESYRNQAAPDFDLHRCLMRFAETLEPKYLPYYSIYRFSAKMAKIRDIMSELNLWVAKCEWNKETPQDLSGVEEKINEIRNLRVMVF